ncbi:MAG: UDP-glucose/GDP-mannose dehydrogenase family protein [Gemmatimonadetes bacterium]|nr:UDP-glucose/GDP-mannose dehydrogenase family protein [Gemmatimonadota bacterium]
MRVAVVGTGYVGLVVGAGLADTGNDVICVDIDEAKIARLNAGEIPIYEPGLDTLVARNLEDGRLKFTTDVPAAVRESAVIFIAVGTPPGEDGSADLQHVLAVAKVIGSSMEDEKVVVTKSTVPVGTAARVRAMIREHTDLPVHVCSNPEFLKEGAAVDDFMKPDRVVIGVDSEHARKVLSDLYAPFVRTGNPVLFMDVASAEITKYAANAMLATRISFMNMIARLCDDVGADISLVRQGIGSDERIGNSFLFAGAGYGGSCFPKDVKALIRTLSDRGVDSGILDAVERVNEDQKRALLRMVDAAFPDGVSGRRFGVWGLSFKPETDDMREAPAIVVIEGLLERGAEVTAHDPEALDVARGVFGDRIRYVDNNYDALEDADALIIITEWKQYRQPDFERIRRLLRQPVVLDGRNLFNPRRMQELGFDYTSIGRPAVRSPRRAAAG